MKIAVTGATGFIGKALCSYLTEQRGAGIISLGRHEHSSDINLSRSDADCAAGLRGVDCLVHLAALAHTHKVTKEDFERNNQQLCRRIATIALTARIPRVVYLSSIKVNGETTQGRAPFTADDLPDPQDEYGKSKLACEKILRDALTNSGIELVIIRPPLVYGSHNKGNLAALQRLIQRGIPLPFAGIRNRRDLVSLDNLCSLISLCCTKPEAAGHTFLASDDQSRSTADIVRLLAHQMQKPARLFRLPALTFTLLGLLKPDEVTRLTGDLQLDISKTKSLLGWSPQRS